MNTGVSLYPSFPKYPEESEAFDGGGGDGERRFHDSSSVIEYQQLYNRYTLCLSRLRDSMEEVDALRRENESLHVSNADLSRRVSLLFSRERLLSEFNRLSVASPPAAAPVSIPVPVPIQVSDPKPLTERNRFDRRNPERTALPKSISVRSKGYLKMMNRSGREANVQKTVPQPTPPSVSQLYL